MGRSFSFALVTWKLKVTRQLSNFIVQYNLLMSDIFVSYIITEKISIYVGMSKEFEIPYYQIVLCNIYIIIMLLFNTV